MGSNIWECEDNHIHIVQNGVEFNFDDIYEFMDALRMWQEYVIFHMMKLDFMPDEAWIAFAEANRN